MKFLLPTGIGDSVWALHKVQAIRNAIDRSGRIDVALSGGVTPLESRALDFVRRFDFVHSAEMRPYSLLAGASVFHPSGCCNYIADGMYEFDGERYCVLIPNAALERGIRLESWQPDYAINWDIFDQFAITGMERFVAQELETRIGPYAVVYPGPLHGNTIDGHNRNALWRPTDWLDLARRVHREFNLDIVAVGAPYDASYYDLLIGPALDGDSPYWHNYIGRTTIGELYAITSRAKFVISYQAGVGIIATYLGTPTAIFWRPQGDSISPDAYLSFDERMASAWVPPKVLAAGTHLPLIYGRHGIPEIMSWAERWA